MTRWIVRAAAVLAVGVLLVWMSISRQAPLSSLAEDAAGAVALVWHHEGSGMTNSGTAFSVDDRGRFLTCAHVVRGRRDVTLAVPGPGGEKNYPARVVAEDVALDAALLEADGVRLPAVRLGSTSGVRVGEEVVFAGFPMGYTLNADLCPTVNFGHVSALPHWRVGARSPRIPIVQIDASVSLGHSGSPLYRASTGEVIGMLKSHVRVPGIASDEDILGVVQSIPAEIVERTGIGIALPADSLRAFLARNGVKP
jgi:S1-C subfamily serine protease